MIRKSVLCMLCMVLSGCSLFKMERSYYKADNSAKPQQQEMSFRSKQHFAKAATLQNKISAEVFFKGLKADSPKAKALYEASFAFLGIAGTAMGVDPSDVNNITLILENTASALKEKEQIIHDLQKDVKDYQQAQTKIVKDKEAEMVAMNGKWKLKMGSLWSWIWFVVIGCIVALVVLGIVQAWTGIPILSALFGGARMLFKGAKQVVTSMQDIRNKLKVEKKNGNKKMSADEVLDMIESSCDVFQDTDVKKWLKRFKGNLRLERIPD